MIRGSREIRSASPAVYQSSSCLHPCLGWPLVSLQSPMYSEERLLDGDWTVWVLYSSGNALWGWVTASASWYQDWSGFALPWLSTMLIVPLNQQTLTEPIGNWEPNKSPLNCECQVTYPSDRKVSKNSCLTGYLFSWGVLIWHHALLFHDFHWWTPLFLGNIVHCVLLY